MLKLSEFFEVPEGVEFNIGKFSPYIIKDNKLMYNNCEVYGVYIDVLMDSEIKIIPPKKTISKDEKVILNNLPSEYTWIARDEDKSLCIYTKKPGKDGCVWYNAGYSSLGLYEHLFQCIKWEDLEPTKICDLLNGE